MPSQKPRPLLRIEYEEAAEAYLKSLPLEHFMEATAQGNQRKITLESLDLVHARRPDVQIFNELLVQYPRRGERKIGQVVPDNMVVIWPEEIRASGSFDLPLQPVGPFWMLEYVSKYNKRKDYAVLSGCRRVDAVSVARTNVSQCAAERARPSCHPGVGCGSGLAR